MKAALSVVLSIATTLLGLLVVTFVISRMLPADPVLAVVGDHASESTIAQARIRLGLDQPLLMQFWIYISDVLQGDLGQSIRTSRPISEELMRVFPATLELATSAPSSESCSASRSASGRRSARTPWSITACASSA